MNGQPKPEFGDTELPRAGETWKWYWLWAEIVRAGPKRGTYRHKTRVGWETSSVPTDQFMARFQKTGLRTTPAAGDDRG